MAWQTIPDDTATVTINLIVTEGNLLINSFLATPTSGIRGDLFTFTLDCYNASPDADTFRIYVADNLGNVIYDELDIPLAGGQSLIRTFNYNMPSEVVDYWNVTVETFHWV